LSARKTELRRWAMRITVFSFSRIHSTMRWTYYSEAESKAEVASALRVTAIRNARQWMQGKPHRSRWCRVV
jgi:hypothetical protein